MKEVAERIKEIRLNKGMTQRQLADRLGWTPSAVSKVENDTYEISLDSAKKIARALEVDPDYLIFGNGDYIREEINLLFDQLTPEQKDSFLQFLRSTVGDRARL